VRDAFSRRVVGWKASDRADTELVLGALEYALWSRRIERERLVSIATTGRRADSTGRRNTVCC
jgi:putative transposase